MARVTFREIRERGNYITGDYERTTKEVEFEGNVSEIDRLIASTSWLLKLPGTEPSNRFIPNLEWESQFPRLPKKSDRW